MDEAMEKEHFLHEKHPLKLVHEGKHDGTEPEADHRERACAGCPDSLQGKVYACDACGFYLHEKCANLNQKMEHFLHSCPLFLQLVPRPENEGATGGERQEMMLSYRCKTCDFGIDDVYGQFQPIRVSKREILRCSDGHPLKLRYEDAGPERYRCNGCKKPISGKCHACHSCGYYLHETCATLPHKIRHFHHHCPLFLKFIDIVHCDACDEIGIHTFFYCCENCNFNMHVRCSQFQPITSEDGGAWIQVWLHHHPLRLEKAYSDDFCHVCERKISARTDDVAVCKSCQFITHKSCLDLPREVQCPFHPCPLFLKFSSLFQCDLCLATQEMCYTYRCKKCHFDMDVQCALFSQEISRGDDWAEHVIRYTHHHTLQLFKDPEEDHLDIFFNRDFKCLICKSPVAGFTYGCKQCGVYLHKPCLDALPQIISMGHGSLYLIRSSNVECHKCRSNAVGFTYFEGQFKQTTSHRRWCVTCALEEVLSIQISPSLLLTNLHFHPCSLTLKLFSTFTCNACFTHCHTHAYYCDQCDFYVGSKCAQISKIKSSKGEEEQIQHFCHWHSLQHSQYMEVSTSPCKVCGNHCSDPSYFCKECNFYIHISCAGILHLMISKNYFNWTLVLLTTSSYECKVCKTENNSGLTFRSIERGFKLCMECVLWPKNKTNGDGTFTSVHHWHKLALVENSGQVGGCLLCRGKGSSLMYYCSQCKDYFHKACAELPFEIQHPLHQKHPLTLISTSRLPESSRNCSLCLGKFIIDTHYSGVYHCKECGFQLDTKCATSIPSIHYRGHRHLLTVVENVHGQEICEVCTNPCPRKNDFYSREKESNYAFRCALSECNFTLHLECGPLPCKIKHSCHVHSLLLEDFFVQENYTDKFVCHVCEDSRDPRLPIYRCAKGCPMVCEIRCVISEVLPKLLGDHGHIKLRTTYPSVTSKLVLKHEVLTMKMDVLRAIPARRAMPSRRNKKYDRENEDEDKNMFKFSKKAFDEFLSKGCTLLPLDSGGALPGFFTQHPDPKEVEKGCWLPQTLVLIYKKLFHKYKIDCEGMVSNLNPEHLSMLCSIVDDMCKTKMVDVTSKRIREWRTLSHYREEYGLSFEFISNKIKLVWDTHFLIKAKAIVDDTSYNLQAKIEELSRKREELLKQLEEITKEMETIKEQQEGHFKYVANGMKDLSKELADALMIKWKPASSIVLFDYFKNPSGWNETEKEKFHEVEEEEEEDENEDKDEDEDKDERTRMVWRKNMRMMTLKKRKKMKTRMRLWM